MNKKIIIIGGGGHSCVLLDILQTERRDIAGYVALKPTEGFELPYLGDDSVLSGGFLAEDYLLVNGVGSTHIPFKRRDIFKNFKSLGYSFLTLIHKNAIISSSAQIGEGAQIMAGCVLQAKCYIGNNVIINTGTTVDHHCIIEEHSHLAPGVTICGDVTIGQTSHIGPNSTLVQGVKIGSESFIPAHLLVKSNIPQSLTDA